MMLAAICKVPELEIDEAEAKSISDAVKKVTAFYPMAIDPKKLAIAELACVLGTVYGPRAIALTITRSKNVETETPAKPKPAPVTVNRPAAAPKPNGKIPVSEMSPSTLYGVEPARDSVENA